ncbi:hypothetical protein PVK06_048190 [Gossypium arboreum]|uniref:DUF4283 domain-containing protein n=1 Tax=Gossypium arboreum TaxID=29729 RepID=A0ABR0MHX1_GOSAR|nr:hypothetical protein PVK06_048190 [Gossypium arboreum]
MSTSMVLKMLGRNIRISTLQNMLYGIWRPSKPFQLMDIENGYFLAKFQNTEDYDKILSQGPWVIFGHYLTVQPWTIDFNPNLPYPNSVLTWIRFPGEIEKGESSRRVPTTVATIGEEEYGPWTLVERRSKRDNLEGNKKGHNLK